MTEWVNNNGKRALLIGVGGIGSNVYLTELQKYGYDVTTVDNFRIGFPVICVYIIM
jgi:nucleoside-diphosphate-sugar epimerase